MRPNVFLVPPLALSLGLASVVSVHAADCGTESPNLQASKSIWTRVSPEDASPLRGRILNFLSGLEGDWQGKGKTTACVMSGASAIPVQAPERIRLTVSRVGQASFDFHFSIYDKHNNVNTSYDFKLQDHGSSIQVVGEGDIAIGQFYDGGIRFRTQTAMRTGFRRDYGGGSTNTMLSLETVRQFIHDDSELNFYKAVFHNGAIIDYSDWHFHRGF